MPIIHLYCQHWRVLVRMVVYGCSFNTENQRHLKGQLLTILTDVDIQLLHGAFKLALCTHIDIGSLTYSQYLHKQKPKNSKSVYFSSLRINVMDRMSAGIRTDWWDSKYSARGTVNLALPVRYLHTNTYVYKKSKHKPAVVTTVF